MSQLTTDSTLPVADGNQISKSIYSVQYAWLLISHSSLTSDPPHQGLNKTGSRTALWAHEYVIIEKKSALVIRLLLGPHERHIHKRCMGLSSLITSSYVMLPSFLPTSVHRLVLLVADVQSKRLTWYCCRKPTRIAL